MTTTVLTPPADGLRNARPRHYLMCPPTYFSVHYSINPWMDPTRPVDSARAVQQWAVLVDAYRAHGHRVDLLEPVPDLPDLVFAANGATVVDGRVLSARFANPQRSAESVVHAAWHRRHGGHLAAPVAVNEAEGDFAVTSSRILAGYGFRTTLDAHRELAAVTGREVVSLQLVDPRFYHLDVALAVLDDATNHIAYYPAAFSPASRALLRALYPDALIASREDAFAFGLNAVSDGRNVFVATRAVQLADQLAAAGYEPVPIDLSELILGGGSVKCCTQEIRPRPTPEGHS